MVNFELAPFLFGLDALEREVRLTRFAASHADGPVSTEDHGRIKSNVEYIFRECVTRLRLIGANTSSWKIEHAINNYRNHQYTHSEMTNLLDRLLTDIKVEVSTQYFFHYDTDSAKTVLHIPVDWELVLSAFPSARREIESGIDCFAFGDYPGSIFHMLRVAEAGLRAIAKECNVRTVRRSVPIEYAMWGDVIAVLRAAIDTIRTGKGNKKPLTAKRRANREIAVEFYSTIMGDMQALQPLRDRTVHLRDTYDKGEAWTAINRTREMMSKMATKLGEATTGKIRWGL